MARLFSTLVSLVWALWFGGMVMLLASVVRLFAAFELDPNGFGRGASALFRFFESYQLALAAMALLGTFGWRFFGSARVKTVLFVLFGLATISAVVSKTLVTPKVETLRQRGLSSTPEFKRMHRVSSAVYMAGAAALLLAGVVLPGAIRSDATARRAGDPHGPSGNGDGLSKQTDSPLAATAAHVTVRD